MKAACDLILSRVAVHGSVMSFIGGTWLAFTLSWTPLLAQSADNPLATRSKGSPTAPVTVYEMSDFQCPYCKKFAQETFPEIEQRYIKPGKVRWVYINFPLTHLHPHAAPAGELALCA